jgi:hypothetical protein
MGKLLDPTNAPVGDAPLTDGAYVDARVFPNQFPYLNLPLPGSPNEPSVTITLQSSAGVQGPFSSIPATYDSATRQLMATQPAGDTSFYRVKADRAGVELSPPTFQGGNVEIGIKTP